MMKTTLKNYVIVCILLATTAFSNAQNKKDKNKTIPSITLNNGVKMPIFGLGTMELRDTIGENSVQKAIKLGYRLFDSATIYNSEEGVGRGIKKSGIDRKELFIATKLWASDMGYENTKKAFAVSLQKLGVDYIDLYMIHRPHGDIPGSWKAMEELYKEGKIRAIGVSNFDAQQLADLVAIATVKPAINQIELNPFFQEPELKNTTEKLGIQVQGWSPFAEGRNGLFTNELLVAIGKKYNKTAAQVTLRWLIQRGVVVIPRSRKLEHLKENMDIFDFKLSKGDMKKIATLDKKTSQFPEWK